MTPICSRRWLALLLLSASIVQRPSAAAQGVDSLFAAFWSAENAQAADGAASAIVESGITFDEALARLMKGRHYSRDVPTGVVLLSRSADGEEFPYSLDVPTTYDPSHAYRVRVQLHGGVGAGEDNRRRGSGAIGELASDRVDGAAGEGQIYVLPTSWLDAPWWSDRQLHNLRAILDRLKRTYNVDENRIVLSGVSDGGTASFYVAMRDPTPFASFLPLNGSLMALAGRNFALGDLFPNNLLNKPFFVVNGERDVLYPSAAIEPIVKGLQRAGVEIAYRPQRGAEHNVAWWPRVVPEFEAFVREHPRNPLPNALTWQSGESDPFNRIDWLVIDRLGPQPAEPHPADVNLIPTPASLRFGVMAVGARISRLLPTSNATALGLAPNGLIVELNGEALAPGADLSEALERCCSPGPSIAMRVERGGAVVSLAVSTRRRADSAAGWRFSRNAGRAAAPTSSVWPTPCG